MKIGSQPIRDSFYTLCHSSMIPRLEAMNGFVSKFNYPSTINTLVSELKEKKSLALNKSSLIDLELFYEDNKGQAYAA